VCIGQERKNGKEGKSGKRVRKLFPGTLLRVRTRARSREKQLASQVAKTERRGFWGDPLRKIRKGKTLSGGYQLRGHGGGKNDYHNRKLKKKGCSTMSGETGGDPHKAEKG